MLFTDVAGSTELLSDLGDEAMERCWREHFAVLRAEVATHRGREVKSMGDGLMVVFDSPSDALACAIAMQAAVAGHARAGGPALRMRVGLHCGPTIEREGDHRGTTVVVAHRLCDVAQPGEILATAAVIARAAPPARIVPRSRGPHAQGPLRARARPRRAVGARARQPPRRARAAGHRARRRSAPRGRHRRASPRGRAAERAVARVGRRSPAAADRRGRAGDRQDQPRRRARPRGPSVRRGRALRPLRRRLRDAASARGRGAAPARWRADAGAPALAARRPAGRPRPPAAGAVPRAGGSGPSLELRSAQRPAPDVRGRLAAAGDDGSRDGRPRGARGPALGRRRDGRAAAPHRDRADPGRARGRRDRARRRARSRPPAATRRRRALAALGGLDAPELAALIEADGGRRASRDLAEAVARRHRRQSAARPRARPGLGRRGLDPGSRARARARRRGGGCRAGTTPRCGRPCSSGESARCLPPRAGC